MYRDTSGHGIFKRALDISPVEAENHDLNAPSGFINGLDQGYDSVGGLH